MYHKWQSYDVWFLRYGTQPTEFFSFWTIFCPLTPLPHPLPPYQPRKSKFWKNENTLGDIIILQECCKNHDQMLYCSWDMAHDGCNYFSFWAFFCLFMLLTVRKIKIKKKWKKMFGNIIILQKCTKNYDQMMYGSWGISPGARRPYAHTHPLPQDPPTISFFETLYSVD